MNKELTPEQVKAEFNKWFDRQFPFEHNFVKNKAFVAYIKGRKDESTRIEDILDTEQSEE
jgi:hypothetical protein